MREKSSFPNPRLPLAQANMALRKFMMFASKPANEGDAAGTLKAKKAFGGERMERERG